MAKSEHLVVTCRPEQIAEELDDHEDWLLIGMSAMAIGSGFGARTEILLAFRRELTNGHTSDALPPGRQRRSPMNPIRA